MRKILMVLLVFGTILASCEKGLDKEAIYKEKDIDKLIELALDGDTCAMNLLSSYYMTKENRTEYDCHQAIKWLKKLAENGVTEAMNEIGFMYLNGNCVGQNNEEAFKWISMAAEKGNLMGMNNMAVFYANGIGVEADLEKAKEWGLKSALKGNSASMLILGQIYSNQENPDYEEAEKWYIKSAIYGCSNALEHLVKCYNFGDGKFKNENEANEVARREFNKSHR